MGNQVSTENDYSIYRRSYVLSRVCQTGHIPSVLLLTARSRVNQSLFSLARPLMISELVLLSFDSGTLSTVT